MARLRLRPSSREKELSTKGSTKNREQREKIYPRRATKGLAEAREGSARGRQGEKGFPGKGKKISTKGHEERRRATKGLEEAREGSARGRQGERKDFQEKAKGYPRRATKNGEGPRRGWRRPERDPPEVAKGRERISRKRQKDFHEGPRRTAKGHEGVGGGSRGACQRSGRGKDFQEKAKGYPRRATKNGKGPRRGWRRPERDPPEVAKGRERISRKRQKDFHEGPRRTAKGHEGVGGGSRGACQRSGRGKDFQEKAKGYPRRATKNGKGPRRGWRRPERDPPEVAKGRERISRKRQKDFHEGHWGYPQRGPG